MQPKSDLFDIFVNGIFNIFLMGKRVDLHSKPISCLTLFDMGGHVGPQNVFDHCPQTLKRRMLKLGDLILIYVASKKVIFGSLGYPALP